MWKTVWTILMTAVFNMTMKRHFGMKLGTTQKIMSHNVIVCWKVTQWVLLFPSHPPSFYLCKVVNFGVATKNLQVEIDHFSSKVDLYIEKQQKKLYAPFFWMRFNWLKAKKPLSGCSLLFTYTYFRWKKSNLTKSNTVYKCLPKPVYVHPAEFMSPKFKVTCIASDIHISPMALWQ